MKVLVTGASGFIGRYIVKDLLNHGYEVRAFVRKKVEIEGAEIFIGDITKRETIEEALSSIDAVFHNAAYASDYGKKEDFYRVNIEGTKNVANACMKKEIKKMVYTSSAGIYGFPNTNEWITEESPKKPINVYQKTKLLSEDLLQKYDMPLTIIRPPLVLGAGGKASFLLLSKIEKGKLSYIGSGDNYITIAHAADVAQCLRLAVEKGKDKEAYNVVKEPSLTKFRVKSFGTTRRISCEKAKKELGFKAMYDLKATVEDMVRWYKNLRKKEGSG